MLFPDRKATRQASFHDREKRILAPKIFRNLHSQKFAGIKRRTENIDDVWWMYIEEQSDANHFGNYPPKTRLR